MSRLFRGLCYFLALIMILGLFPLAALAEDTQNLHTVQFQLNYNGAPKLDIQKVNHGDCATQPNGVYREGWIFQYWYRRTDTGNEKFDLSQPITEDITLYAKWKEDVTYWAPVWDSQLRGIQGGEENDETDLIAIFLKDNEIYSILDAKLQEIENSYNNTEPDINRVCNDMIEYLEKQLQLKNIQSYTVYDTCIRIVLPGGAVYVHSLEYYKDCKASTNSTATTAFLPSGIISSDGDKQILVLAPYNSEGLPVDAYSIASLYVPLCIPEYGTPTVLTDSAVTFEVLENLNQYSIVMINSHGGHTEKDHSFIATGERVTDVKMDIEQYGYSSKYIKYIRDVYSDPDDKEIIYLEGDYYGVTYRFFEKNYEDDSFEDTLMYLGCCYGAGDSVKSVDCAECNVLTDTLLRKGVDAIYCCRNEVKVVYDNKMVQTIFEELSKDTTTTVYDALRIAKEKHGATDGFVAELYIRGDLDYTLAGKDTLRKNITLKFVDTVTGENLTCDTVSMKVTGYAGLASADRVFTERELSLIHVMNTDSSNYSAAQLSLPYGTYQVTFSAIGYEDAVLTWTDIRDATFVIDENTSSIPISMTPSKRHTLRVKFVDGETGEKLSLIDLFPASEYDVANGCIYNNAYIGLANDTIEYEYEPGGFLNGFRGIIEDNELVFTNLIDHDGYYLLFDALFNEYVLSDWYRDWYHRDRTGYIHVLGDTTYSVKLYKEYLIVGDVEVTSENCHDILGDGTASYTEGKLTLTNANITADAVIQARLQNLTIVIPANTTSYLYETDGEYISVINNLGGPITIETETSADERGKLYIKGCIDNFCCIQADSIDIRHVDITFDDARAAMRSTLGDTRVYRSKLSEGSPNSIPAYFIKSAYDIELTNVKITDVANSGAALFAGNDIEMYNSDVTFSGLYVCIDARSGALYAYNTTIDIKATGDSSNDALIWTGTGIYFNSPYSHNNTATCQITTPQKAAIMQDEEGYYSIRNADGTYPAEIHIEPIAS